MFYYIFQEIFAIFFLLVAKFDVENLKKIVSILYHYFLHDYQLRPDSALGSAQGESFNAKIVGSNPG